MSTLTLRERIEAELQRARLACYAGKRGVDAVITAVYLDTTSYHELCALHDLTDWDRRALDRGEWAGAPLFVVVRAGSRRTERHIKAIGRLI